MVLVAGLLASGCGAMPIPAPDQPPAAVVEIPGARDRSGSTPALDPTYFSESFDLSSYRKAACSAFDKELKKLQKSTTYIAKVVKSVGKDSYEAFAEKEKKDFASHSTVVGLFGTAVDSGLRKQLDLAFADAGFVESDSARFVTLYLDRWTTDSLSSCKKLDAYTSAKESAMKAAEQTRAIQRLADAKPWYPKGFEEYNANFAVKYLKHKDFRCAYYSEGCAGFQVVSKKRMLQPLCTDQLVRQERHPGEQWNRVFLQRHARPEDEGRHQYVRQICQGVSDH